MRDPVSALILTVRVHPPRYGVVIEFLPEQIRRDQFKVTMIEEPPVPLASPAVVPDM